MPLDLRSDELAAVVAAIGIAQPNDVLLRGCWIGGRSVTFAGVTAGHGGLAVCGWWCRPRLVVDVAYVRVGAKAVEEHGEHSP
jgi:hypothetical protein